MSARRPNRRQFDSSTGPRYAGAVVRSVSPFDADPWDVAVQFDSAMIFPVLVGGPLSDAKIQILMLGVDAVGGVWRQDCTVFTPLSESAVRITFSAGAVALDSDKPHAVYLPANSALFRPANGGVVRGWLDPAEVVFVDPGPAGWIVCSAFVL